MEAYFFCSMNFAGEQARSYTTSLPNTGVVRCYEKYVYNRYFSSGVETYGVSLGSRHCGYFSAENKVVAFGSKGCTSLSVRDIILRVVRILYALTVMVEPSMTNEKTFPY